MPLTLSDAQLLVQISRYNERSLGPLRFLARFAAPSSIRVRYRFLVDEGRWLQRFAEATRDDFLAANQNSLTVSFTPRAVIAFWGALLAALASPRARRRLSAAQIAEREQLAAKLQKAASSLPERVLAQELGTRRPVDAERMRGLLSRSQ